jgi:hypothetical protein
VPIELCKAHVSPKPGNIEGYIKQSRRQQGLFFMITDILSPFKLSFHHGLSDEFVTMPGLKPLTWCNVIQQIVVRFGQYFVRCGVRIYFNSMRQ